MMHVNIMAKPEISVDIIPASSSLSQNVHYLGYNTSG